jgi:hypothetical protein
MNYAMISGHNIIGFDIKASGEKKLQAFSTAPGALSHEWYKLALNKNNTP